MKSSNPSDTVSPRPRAVTLIHKGAMPVGSAAVRSFARYYGDVYELEIHTDGSLDEADIARLSEEAGEMPHHFVGPAEREAVLGPLLAVRPRTRALISLGAYFTKLQLPMVIAKPYFYFDSDIVWLRKAGNLNPPGTKDVFSTETWSWYYGAANDREWVRQGVPRRVNSGFYHLDSEFPFDRMEEMLERGLFDHTADYNTDQEIMAYLFPDLTHYHIDDFKRTRVGVRYDMRTEACIALHFPGGMWKDHLDQIAALDGEPDRPEALLRITPATPLTTGEMLRMRYSLAASRVGILKFPIRIYRALRGKLKGQTNHS
jgi:hypothetical protein